MSGTTGKLELRFVEARHLELVPIYRHPLKLVMAHLLINNTKPIRVLVTDDDDDPVDPATLVARVVAPDLTETTYTYGVDSEIQRNAVGDYEVRILSDQARRWYLEVTTTTPDAVAESSWVVEASKIPGP